MSEPEYKIQFSYQNSNIESAVPGEQKLRDPSLIKPSDAIEVDAENVWEENEERREDYVLTPVMTITKEEATFSKGDLKLQKISVTEDISEPIINTFTLHEKAASETGDPEYYDVVFRKPSRRRTATDEKDSVEKKTKTRIPTLRFRQAVDRLKQDRKQFEDKRGDEDNKEPETPQPTPRRSSIPRLKDSRIPPPSGKDFAQQKAEEVAPTSRVSDEFDRLYDEIADDQESFSNLSIISRIEDPVKVENKFEEIIHAYEETEVRPVTVEKVKVSKIPLLKRKSEQEIEVPKTAHIIKQNVSVDATKIKNSDSHNEKSSKIQSVTLNKSPLRTGLISNRVLESKPEPESTTESVNFRADNVKKVEGNYDNNNNKVVNNTIEQEKSINTETMSEMNDTVKSPMSFVKSMTNETKPVKIIEEQKLSQQKEKSIESNDFDIEKTRQNGKNDHIEVQSENKNEEDIPILRGKVSRILNRINSLETETKPSKINGPDETLKNKSVLSKIAMFERPEPVDDTPKPIVRCISQLSKVKNDEFYDTTKIVPDDKPKIVEEVLKSMPAREIEGNDDIYPSKDFNNQAIRNDDNEPAKKLNPEVNEHKFYCQVLDIQPQVNVQTTIVEEIKTDLSVYQISDKQQKESDEIPIDSPTQSNSGDDKPTFINKIIEIQPIVKMQPMNVEEIKVDINDLKHTNDTNDNDFNTMDNKESISTSLNENSDRAALSSPVEIQNKQDYVDIKSNSIKNKVEDKNDSQEIDFKPILIKENDDWISKLSNEYLNYLKGKNNTEPIYTKTEIISDIDKQEVKYDRVIVSKSNEKPAENEIGISNVKRDEKAVENSISNRKIRKDEGLLRIHSYRNHESDMKTKSKSLAELDLGDGFKGRVGNMVVRMNSLDRGERGKRDVIDVKERPRNRSVSEKIALFESKLTPVKTERRNPSKFERKELQKFELSGVDYAGLIEELGQAKAKYGCLEAGRMRYLELRDGGRMPVLGIGTALLDPKLARPVVEAAIDLGYRTIDTAYIYGNEKEVGEAIREKIKDGTVKREDLFVVSKLWSTFHRRDLVQQACRASLEAMGLDYFDLYLIHNPMSFKEGRNPVPKIASVVQYSEHDYLGAWYGMEELARAGLVRRVGLSNFNSVQVDRVVEKGKIKPVVNQVECHPYLSQHRLEEFCEARAVKLCCFGVLGSKGTPLEHRGGLPPAIDDPLVRVMAAGMGVSPAALLISYQLALGRAVVVKASNPTHLWDNLQALQLTLTAADVSALHALNRNKRNFTFKGMGDTHRNYPFNIPF